MSRRGRWRPGQAGVSLLETLVALALGLMVITTLLTQVLSSRQGQSLQLAQAQMIEDASLALELLRQDLMMAGHAWPLRAQTGPGGQPSWQDGLGSSVWVACDAGFDRLPSDGPPTCATSASGTMVSSALELAYQVDRDSAVVGSDGKPTDCLGNAIEPTTLADGQVIYRAFNRWQISSSGGRTELRCGGRGRTGPQPLVDNVERLLILWGLPVDTAPGTALRYVSAAQVSDWTQIRAVRVCVQLRSAEPVLGLADQRDDRDCEGRLLNATDGRLRRSFSSTVAWRQARP